MVEARASQAGLYGLIGEIPPTRVSQGGIYALISTGVPTRVSQAGMNALVAVTAEVRITQGGIYLLGHGSPCTGQLCQIWKIIRTDGEIYRFTSKDTDWTYLGEEYKACDSLVPSASEEVSEVDAAGNMDLSGAISSTGIKQEELYAGLFDGATVEVWAVHWSGTGRPRRLIKGRFGHAEQTKTGFKVEVVGDGEKLKQTPLVSMVSPVCRWVFGDPVTCGVDLGPLTVTGTIDSATGQRSFVDAARAEAAGYFTRGRVTFTTGDNSGVSAEIKEHSAGGNFELWPRLPFPISVGDQYSMTPGCTLLKESSGGTNGCEAWNNLERYGGFRHVPGRDKRTAAANVRQ